MPRSNSNSKPKYDESNYQSLINKEARDHFNKKMVGVSYSYLDVLAHEHAVAFTVAKMMDEDLLKETRDAIASALENGTDFNTFKQRLKPYLMSKGWWGEQVVTAPSGDKQGTKQTVQLGSMRRLRTIYHTNKHTAYAAGQWERIQQTKDMLPYLQYMPSLSENKRLDHKKYYNLVREVDDAIWQVIYPPNGYGCKCWVKQLTRRQAEALGETPKEDLPFEDATEGVEASFQHNHGDRLGAILKIAQDKHGSEFTKRLQAELDGYVLGLVASQTATPVVSFAGVTARQAEVARLAPELNGTPKPYEGLVAEEWQQYHNVTLERFDADKHKVLVAGKSADYAVLDADKPSKEWTTLDFMFAISNDNAEIMSYRMFDSTSPKDADFREKTRATMQKHLDKADIVPMDLRRLDIRLRVKIVGFVLSLPIEQQRKIVLITGG